MSHEVVVSGPKNAACHTDSLPVVLPRPPGLLRLGWEGESEFLRTTE